MKARLEGFEANTQLTMDQLDEGQIAVVLEEYQNIEKGYVLFAVRAIEGEIKIYSLGDPLSWDLGQVGHVPIRLLKAGDKIVLGE